MRSAILLAAALLVAPAAHAVPLEFTATSFTWGPLGPQGWNVTATTSIELVDLADPDPGIGRFRLDLAGEVVTFSSPDRVEFVWFNTLSVVPGDGFLGVSLLNATGVLQTSGHASPDQASMSHWLTDSGSSDALPVLPPVMDWTASWEITVDADAVGELSFWWGNGFQSCTEVGPNVYCDGGTLSTGGFSVQVSPAPIPEPGTASLLAAGLMGLVLLRRHVASESSAPRAAPGVSSRP